MVRSSCVSVNTLARQGWANTRSPHQSGATVSTSARGLLRSAAEAAAARCVSGSAALNAFQSLHCFL
jgi:hypothetical protein